MSSLLAFKYSFSTGDTVSHVGTGFVNYTVAPLNYSLVSPPPFPCSVSKYTVQVHIHVCSV
jgi:hypothetical protein